MKEAPWRCTASLVWRFSIGVLERNRLIPLGLLSVSPANSFLVAITGREQVATIRERLPVYVITNVALIPLSSRTEAARAINKAKPGQKSLADSAADTGSDTEGEVYIDDDDASVVDDEIQDDIDAASKAAAKAQPESQAQSSIGQDVFEKKGQYGRFAEKWFSKRGWTVDRRRAEGMTSLEGELPKKEQKGQLREEKQDRPTDYDKPENKPQPESSPSGSSTSLNAEDENLKDKVKDVEEEVKENVAHSLTPKLLHTTKLLLATSRR